MPAVAAIGGIAGAGGSIASTIIDAEQKRKADLAAIKGKSGGKAGAFNASDYTTSYGNISPASIGAIQRGLLQTEAQGGDKFFGEPMLDINDFNRRDIEMALFQTPTEPKAIFFEV